MATSAKESVGIVDWEDVTGTVIGVQHTLMKVFEIH
jgi:hypothetical protein